MGCHGHGYWGHSDWHGDCWGQGAGYGCGPRWDEEARFAETFERGPCALRAGSRRYVTSSVAGATAAAQLEARLASLQDEVRAVAAELAEMRTARERVMSRDPEI